HPLHETVLVEIHRHDQARAARLLLARVELGQERAEGWRLAAAGVGGHRALELVAAPALGRLVVARLEAQALRDLPHLSADGPRPRLLPERLEDARFDLSMAEGAARDVRFDRPPGPIDPERHSDVPRQIR